MMKTARMIVLSSLVLLSAAALAAPKDQAPPEAKTPAAGKGGPRRCAGELRRIHPILSFLQGAVADYSCRPR